MAENEPEIVGRLVDQYRYEYNHYFLITHKQYQSYLNEIQPHSLVVALLEGVLNTLGLEQEIEKVKQELEDSIRGHTRIVHGLGSVYGKDIEIVDEFKKYLDISPPKNPIWYPPRGF